METFPHKAVPEIVLQKYVTDKFSQFQRKFQELCGSRISMVRPNPAWADKFPDLDFLLENGKTIPVEVEWKTRSFLDHQKNKKGFASFKKNKGIVFVVVKEKGYDLGSTKQVEIDLDKFVAWFSNPKIAKKIVYDATKEFREMKKGRPPEVWFTLLTTKGDALKHFAPALNHKTWGIKKKYKVNSESRLENIQSGDTIAFLAGGCFESNFYDSEVATLL